jgi:hypothetical protein
MTAGRSDRELWWINQEFSPVDIILPWFSVLIYHMGEEQNVSWWQQFGDVILSH